MCTEANSEEPQHGMVGLDEFPPSTEPERPMIGAILFVFLGAEAFVLILTHGWDNVVARLRYWCDLAGDIHLSEISHSTNEAVDFGDIH